MKKALSIVTYAQKLCCAAPSGLPATVDRLPRTGGSKSLIHKTIEKKFLIPYGQQGFAVTGFQATAQTLSTKLSTEKRTTLKILCYQGLSATYEGDLQNKVSGS
jgi:hypothetical protein